MNVINKPQSDFFSFQPFLNDSWGRPLAFSLIEKGLVSVFGNTEYVFRLFPFIGAVASVFFFYALVKKVLGGVAVPLALLIFAVSDPLIYYAAELKQYSTDVAVVLILYLWWLGLQQKMTSRKIWLLGLGGSLAVWFSHPSIFVLGTFLFIMAVDILSKRAWDKIPAVVGFFLLIVWSSGLTHVLLIRHALANHVLVDGWGQAFLSLNTGFCPIVSWLARAGADLLQSTVGFGWPWAAVGVCLVGGVVTAKENRKEIFLLIGPIFFAVVASAFKKYPFSGRLLLFLAPMVIILLARGLAFFIEHPRRWLAWGGIILTAAILYPTVTQATYYFAYNRPKPEMRPVMQYLSDHVQSGDTVVVNQEAENVYWYYGDRFQIVDKVATALTPLTWQTKTVFGARMGEVYKSLVDSPSGKVAIARDIFPVYDKMRTLSLVLTDKEKSRYEVVRRGSVPISWRKKRVWIILSPTGAALRQYLLDVLDSAGKRVQGYKRYQAVVYLYDLDG